jgi:DNA-binding response OmpR family regulator
MRILLVDDEVEFVSTLSVRLSFRGIEADYVTSGKQAVAAVSEKEYDLVVLDMKMAGLDGLETMETIRKSRPNMKFIILTGHGDEDAYHRGKAAGCAFYLVKPLDIDVFIQKINQAVGNEAETA